MKIRMKSIYAGPRGSFSPGQVADLDQASAYALIEGGFAEQIDEPATVEEATATGRETATAPAQRKKPAARRK